MANNAMPYNLEAERSVLGCILIDQVVQAEMIDELTSDDFLVDSHRKIFSAMRDIYARNLPVDIVTLA
ncbi:MAG: replicative DNA helicase, partial [Clostridia bacterium]|nr:replicative DNA helicase [Clostridia bacterium]